MKNFLLTRGALPAALLIACLGAAAQDSSQDASQDGPAPGASLADLARKTRAQKQSAQTPGSVSKAQELASQLEQEQEESENAPVGFKTYNAGDYRLWVPFPYEVEGRDEIGTVLAGSRVGVTNTVVMAGNPLSFPPNLDDATERNLVSQVARFYSQSSGCGAIKFGERRAYRCGLNRAWLMGNEVSGTMLFLMGPSSVIPVMCVSPDDNSKCLTSDKWGYHTCANQNPSWDEVQKTKADLLTRNQDQRTTAQVCDQVIYPSIRLREDLAPRSFSNPASEGTNQPAPAKTAAKLPAGGGPQAVAKSAEPEAAATPSLADVVRHAKESAANQPKAKRKLDATDGGGLPPAGFKSASFSYCQGPDYCWQASLFLPLNAVPTDPRYPEFVYEAPLGQDRLSQDKLGQDKVLLFAGFAHISFANRGGKDPSVALWREINADDSVGQSGLQAVTRDEATIAGMPGFLTHFEIKRNDTIWVGIRANVVSRGVELMVGCLAPKQRFGDADQDCSTLIDSLRLP
ncbi:MAG TPA: hypothetical protein VKR60_12025 [Candidatus Sulfotelmatobacter sp.]|nr:hypothetical protein [Candidatus Sulfotelmatobacter sp.]